MLIINKDNGEMEKREPGETSNTESRIQQPMTEDGLIPLMGHTSEETAFEQDDYPYGSLRCKRRVWVETALKGQQKGGMRFVAQTSNPKNNNTWNKPHPGTYNDYVLMYLDTSNSHVEYLCLSLYMEIETFNAFLNKWWELLDAENQKKVKAIGDYITKRAERAKTRSHESQSKESIAEPVEDSESLRDVFAKLAFHNSFPELRQAVEEFHGVKPPSLPRCAIYVNGLTEEQFSEWKERWINRGVSQESVNNAEIIPDQPQESDLKKKLLAELYENVVYINTDHLGQHHSAIMENGWAVATAPRPIPGEVTWQDNIRHGPFLAAGPIEQYGKEWLSLDAWGLSMINNRHIVKEVRNWLESEGTSLEEALKTYTIRELAAQLPNPLPWRDPEPVSAHQIKEVLESAKELSIEGLALRYEPREGYEYTQFALSARERVNKAVRSLVDWGYAIVDGDRLLLAQEQPQQSEEAPLNYSSQIQEEAETMKNQITETLATENQEGQFDVTDDWADGVGDDYQNDDYEDDDGEDDADPNIGKYVAAIAVAADSHQELTLENVDSVLDEVVKMKVLPGFQSWIAEQEGVDELVLQAISSHSVAPAKPTASSKPAVSPVAQATPGEPAVPGAAYLEAAAKIAQALTPLSHVPAEMVPTMLTIMRPGIVASLDCVPKKAREPIADRILAERDKPDFDIARIIQEEADPKPVMVRVWNQKAFEQFGDDFMSFLKALSEGETEFGGQDNDQKYGVKDTALAFFGLMTIEKDIRKGGKKSSSPRKASTGGSGGAKGEKTEKLVEFLKAEPRTIEEICEFSGVAESAVKASLRAHLPAKGHTIAGVAENGELVNWWPTYKRPDGVALQEPQMFQIVD